MNLRIIALGSAVVILGVALLGAMFTPAPPGPTAWDWLEDTYWFVPPSGLPNQGFTSTSGDVQVGLGQTVYHIESCRYGYFKGINRTQVVGGPLACQTLIGSVTPEGDVQLTFLWIDDNGVVTQRTDARGVMRRRQGEWMMENQMTSGGGTSSTAFLTHWAYMKQTEPGDASFDDLPLVHVSVPEFLAGCR